MQVLINIDVDDLERGVDFYRRAFDLRVHRRFGKAGAELSGAVVPIFLLLKPTDSEAVHGSGLRRDYARHWTPVHIDVVVDDVDVATARAIAAGATLEQPSQTHRWGRIAHLADPFGHGICLLQFLGRGYDEIAPAEADAG